MTRIDRSTLLLRLTATVLLVASGLFVRASPPSVVSPILSGRLPDGSVVTVKEPSFGTVHRVLEWELGDELKVYKSAKPTLMFTLRRSNLPKRGVSPLTHRDVTIWIRAFFVGADGKEYPLNERASANPASDSDNELRVRWWTGSWPSEMWTTWELPETPDSRSPVVRVRVYLWYGERGDKHADRSYAELLLPNDRAWRNRTQQAEERYYASIRSVREKRSGRSISGRGGGPGR